MNIDKIKELLILHEAKRNKIYKCSQGFNTIGIGHNLDTNPISDRAIDIIFEDDLNEVINALDKYIPWWKTLSENRQHVLIDMAFNLGVGPSTEFPTGQLLKFKNTLKAMQEGRFEDASKGMGSSLWATQVGNRATRLINMMLEG